MYDYQPGDFGETGSQSDANNSARRCPRCSKMIPAGLAVCPNCALSMDEEIQVDLHPETPSERLRKIFKPRNVILSVLTVAAALGLYGYFVLQRFSSASFISAGDRFMQEQNYSAAADSYRQALQTGSQMAEVYEKLAWAEYQLSQDAEALGHFEDALSMEPDRWLSLYGAGLSAYRVREYDRAVAHLSRAVALAPDQAGAYAYLGLAEYRLGDYEAAYAHLTEAWVYDPQDPTTLYYLGQTLAMRKEFDAAVERLTESESLGFEPGAVFYARGLAHMQAENLGAAHADLQKALAAYPGRADVALSLAKASYLMNDFSAAAEQLAAVQAQISPGHMPEFLALAGWVAMRREDFAKAGDAFNQWVNLEPDNAEAMNSLGWAAYYSGDCKTAIFYFKKAIQLQDEWAGTHTSLNNAEEIPQTGLQCK